MILMESAEGDFHGLHSYAYTNGHGILRVRSVGVAFFLDLFKGCSGQSTEVRFRVYR